MGHVNENLTAVTEGKEGVRSPSKQIMWVILCCWSSERLFEESTSPMKMPFVIRSKRGKRFTIYNFVCIPCWFEQICGWWFNEIASTKSVFAIFTTTAWRSFRRSFGKRICNFLTKWIWRCEWFCTECSSFSLARKALSSSATFVPRFSYQKKVFVSEYQ